MASEGLQSSHWYVTDLDLSLQFHHHGLVIIAIVLVFVILFISFLLCNFLYQCNQIMSIHGSGISSSPGAVAASIHAQNKGLDEATINSLPIFLHSSLRSSETDFQALSVCVLLKKMKWLRSFPAVCICTILNVLINGYKIVQFVLFVGSLFVLLLLWKWNPLHKEQNPPHEVERRREFRDRSIN